PAPRVAPSRPPPARSPAPTSAAPRRPRRAPASARVPPATRARGPRGPGRSSAPWRPLFYHARDPVQNSSMTSSAQETAARLSEIWREWGMKPPNDEAKSQLQALAALAAHLQTGDAVIL